MNIVLTVASSGITTQLLCRGTTVHLKFTIPINIDEFLTCNVKQGLPLVELLAVSKLII